MTTTGGDGVIAGSINVVAAIEMPGFETFLIVADIESGAVMSGMEVVIPITKSARRGLKIQGVGPALHTDSSRIGIVLDAAAWRRLAGMGDEAMADGTVLEVREASA